MLALHESPRSSLSLLPVIDALADRYCVIAPDTPGYGLSDPLPGETPSLDDFLDVIAGLLDDLGVERVAIYGAHTGAALATAFAVREPHRVTALVLDGLSAFDAEEVAAFRTRYLTPYEPHWDGRHVMALWSRAKDLFTWFPWYEQSAGRRLATEPQAIGVLHKSALGFLQAGAEYAKAYTLAAAYQPNAVLQALRAPATVIARPDDLIADHLDRLMQGPSWEITWLGPDLEEWAQALVAGIARGDTPDTAQPPTASADGSRFLAVGAGWLHVMLAGPMDGPVRVLLPGLPGDLSALLAAQSNLHPQDRVVAISPPGCGRSDPLSDPTAGLEAVIDALDAALQALRVEPASLAGEGASAVIATLWARRRGWPIEVAAIDPPAWLATGAPLPDGPLLTVLPPAWDGTHLTGAWFQLRDLQLYDIPPGRGPPLRRRNSDSLDVRRFDRLFRSYVEGPECAALLAQVVDHLRTHPADRLPPKD
ncbi:alpha/beta fold hydrolase [Phenylobacterium sp.]|uniref:alpha/beta fold hydrolase n=1 Tax=Phenylobacterium sp. TaxID=1871053 RepID=UPI00374CF5FF